MLILAIVILLIAELTIFNNPLVIFSDSMSPTLSKGSIAYLETVSFDQLKIGDIIAFDTKARNVLVHRIYNITGQGIVTKGDNNSMPDNFIVVPNDVIGKVNFSLPLIGYLYIIPSYFVGLSMYNIVAFLIQLLLSFVLSWLIIQVYDKIRK